MEILLAQKNRHKRDNMQFGVHFVLQSPFLHTHSTDSPCPQLTKPLSRFAQDQRRPEHKPLKSMWTSPVWNARELQRDAP